MARRSRSQPHASGTPGTAARMGDREAASRRGKGSLGSRTSAGRRGDVGGSRAGARGSRLLGTEREQSAPFSAVGGQGAGDRKSVVSGRSVSVHVYIGGRPFIKKNTKEN